MMHPGMMHPGMAMEPAGGSAPPPVWLELPEDELPAELEGITERTAPVLVYTKEDEERQSLQSSATHLLSDLCGGEISTQVAFHDDPEWTLFPQIGEAIKRAKGEVEC